MRTSNCRLAGPDDQRDIFERLCDFYNGYDPSIGVQMTLSSRHEDKNGNLFGMDAQGDALDDMRCLLYTSPSPRDAHESRMPSSA